MSRPLDRIEAQVREEIHHRVSSGMYRTADVLALVNVAKAAEDDSLVDALAIIEHGLSGGSAPDALRAVRTIIVKHRLPIRDALAVLDEKAGGK